MLDTLENVKTYLGIVGSGDDAALTMVLAEADAMIKAYVGYNIEEATITDEYHSTDGEVQNFNVAYPPISSGDTVAVKYDGTVYDSTEYDVIYDRGIVVMNSAPSQSVKLFSISYTGGYATIPADLLAVFRGLCNDLYKSRKRESGVASERLGDYSRTFTDSRSADPLSSYMATLNKYKIYAF
jgi:hypothetical protein